MEKFRIAVLNIVSNHLYDMSERQEEVYLSKLYIQTSILISMSISIK